MKAEDLLPIGSVVLLHDTDKRIMVFGVWQKDKATDIEYDYIGVLYPEGNIGEEGQFLFNQSDIAQVFFKGFEDDERNDFIKRLDEFYNK